MERIVAREAKNSIDWLSDASLTLDHEEFENIKAGAEIDANFVGILIPYERGRAVITLRLFSSNLRWISQ